MDKLTYLAELAEGLARWVPERERQDILRYYAEYFDEAGPDKEGQVVAELGDPWALSCRLAVEGGYVTQQGADSWTPRQNKRKRWPLVLAGTVACVAIVSLSVGQMASDVGRAFGRWVSDQTANVAQVEEGIGFVTLPQEPSVEFIEGKEFMGGFWTEQNSNLDPFLSIDANISLGNITVTEGSDFTLYIQYPGNLSHILEWEVKDGVLKIRDSDALPHVEVSSWEDFWDLFGGRSEAARVDITVPAGTLLETLEFKTGLGDVFLSGLEVNKIESKTGLGDVECFELQARKKLTLKSGMGDVNLGLEELWDGVAIELKTGMGNVEASLDCPERACRYEVKTGMGNILINGQSRGTKAVRDGSAPYKLEIDNGMGDINLYFQEG
ncbi:MAG: DUF4097 family beta strand repeat-containing protein [Oscillospiraceae bacterium]|nr:DUF4097 family beta strand repeat-containing protein [Oscillospiraceae bacterium]